MGAGWLNRPLEEKKGGWDGVSSQWTVDSGHWAVDSGQGWNHEITKARKGKQRRGQEEKQLTVDSGQWNNGRKWKRDHSIECIVGRALFKYNIPVVRDSIFKIEVDYLFRQVTIFAGFLFNNVRQPLLPFIDDFTACNDIAKTF